MPTQKPPQHPEDDKRQHRQAGPLMDIHPPDIRRHDIGDNGCCEAPVEQSQRQIPDKQAVCCVVGPCVVGPCVVGPCVIGLGVIGLFLFGPHCFGHVWLPFFGPVPNHVPSVSRINKLFDINFTLPRRKPRRQHKANGPNRLAQSRFLPDLLRLLSWRHERHAAQALSRCRQW